MSTAGRNNFNVNGRGVDSAWFGDEGKRTELHQPVGYKRTHDYVNETLDINSPDVPQYGAGYVKFQFDKKGELLGKMTLFYTRSAITGAGIGTLPAFNDFEGYSSIDRIVWIYNGREFLTQHGDDLYLELERKSTETQYQVEGYNQNGNLTPLERSNKGAIPQTLAVDLRVPWAHIKRRLFMHVLPLKLECRVHFKKLGECARVADAATSSCTISNCFIKANYTHLPLAIRDNYFNYIMSSKNGFHYKLTTLEYHKELPIASAFTGKYRYELRNMKNPSYFLDIQLRPKSCLQTSATLDRFNFVLPNRMWLEDNGTRISDVYYLKDEAQKNMNLYTDTSILFPRADYTLKCPGIPFCHKELVLASETDCYNQRNLVKYNNLEIILEFDTAPGEDLLLDVTSHIHNFLIQHRGDVRIWLI